MLLFPGMIASHAEAAGMKVPKEPDKEFDNNEFPHFHVFCEVQLGRPILSHCHVEENAKLIAEIPEERIKKVTLSELLELGLHWAQ